MQAPGAYTVQTDEELLEGLSFLAYRRVATVIFVPLRHGGPGSLQAITIDPRELADTLRTPWRETDRARIASSDEHRTMTVQNDGVARTSG